MINVTRLSAHRSRAYLLSVIVFLSAAPGTALAQARPATGQADTVRGTIHIVQKGDTLWELSARYLNNPKAWPSVFEANSQIIANPHRIYPGQRIWFPAGGGPPIVLSFEEVWPESRIDVTQAALEVGQPAREGEPSEPAAAQETPVPEETDTGQLTVIVRAVEKKYYPLASTVAILAAGYIGDSKDWPRGKIIGGESREMNLSVYNQVFLDVGESDAEVGDIYIVVEQGPRVRHPEWGHRMGRKIEVKGIIRIVDVERRTSQGVLVSVFDAVHNSDRIIPAPDVDSRPWKEFVPVQGGRSGFVVARAKPEGNLHPYDKVFIDGGSEEGVRVGDLYVLRRPQTERGRLRFYEQELGRAVVIAVQEKTATVMLLSVSSSDIAAGEKVELVGRSVFVESTGSGQ